MKKQLQKTFNMKKTALLLLAFIGFSSFQTNAQTELTVADLVAVEAFTLGTGGALTASDAAVFEGTGALSNQDGYLRITSTETFADHKTRLTFNLKSTAADVTSTLTFKFRKRIGNNIAGFVSVDGTTTNVTLAGTNAASFTQTGTVASNSFEDVEVVLDDITLTPTAQTIIFTFTSVDQNLGTNNPQIRFEEISINKTAVVGGCTEAVEVTALAVSDETATTLDLGWTNSACFDEVLVVAKATSAVTNIPSGDGSTYTADADFTGAGTDLGSSEIVVFKGTANTATVTGLTPNVDYHFAVFTRKGIDWSAAVTVNDIPNTFVSITSGANADLVWTATTSWTESIAPSSATDNVRIRGHFLLNDDVVVNNVTFVDDGTERIEINPGFSLTANDVTMINGSNIILTSDATQFSSLIVTSINDTQNAIYDRWVNDSPNNDLISAPLTGIAFTSVALASQNENRFFLNPSDATNYFFGPFDNTDSSFKTYKTGVDDAVSIVSGKGYRAATIDGAANTVRFQGAVLVAGVDIDITDGGATASAEWNLIGNPYPSYIDFEDFYTANSGEFDTTFDAVYGWNGTSYEVWNSITIAAGTPLLAPGQGFFVKTKPDVDGTVSFATTMRRIGSDNDFVSAKSNNEAKIALAKINLSNATKTFKTDIYFVENQTRGLDAGYDAGALFATSKGIYTNLVEDNTGVSLAVQALPYNDFNNVVVPVAINGESGVELTISLDVTSLTIPADTYVYLKDNVLNTTTLLNDTDYKFTPDATLNGAGRFFIEFSAKAVLATDDYALSELLIYTNQTSKAIMIKGILKADASAKVYDIQGRMVLEQKLDSSNITNVINANALTTGVYMVQLEDKIQKVIIK